MVALTHTQLPVMTMSPTDNTKDDRTGRIDDMDRAVQFVNNFGDIEKGRLLQALLQETSERTIRSRIFAAMFRRTGLSNIINVKTNTTVE